MVWVCLSHFGIGIQLVAPRASIALELLGMIASPMFIMLSAGVVGYLTTVTTVDAHGLRVRFVDRGLFLLLVAHVLIVVPHFLRSHQWVEISIWPFMTDAMGVSLILAAFLVGRTNRDQRLALAAIVYVVGWALVLNWEPSGRGLVLVKKFVVGYTQEEIPQQNFPFAPWFAFYLAATVLGETIAASTRTVGLEVLGRRLMAMGPVAVILAALIKASYYAVRPRGFNSYKAMPPFWRDVYEMTTPFDKYPPGPTYLLFFGGLALMVIGSTFWASARGRMPRLLEAAAVVGRASLFVFVVQFFIYYLLVPRLPLPTTALLVPYFLASVSFLWAIAGLWGRIRGNRYFTIGLAALDRRHRGAVPR